LAGSDDVKIGITLPTFTKVSENTLATAGAADEAGIDGVFVFDHIWPIGQPSRPALSAYPALGAIVATTSRLRVGPLVARLGLLPDRLVIDSLVSLHELTGGRLIAALGIGDRKSSDENEAYGIAWPGLESRRASLDSVLRQLMAEGIECWVGATAPATLEIARAAGATVNMWDVDLSRIETEAALGPVTWAGPVPAEATAAAAKLAGLRDAGATWAIWGWPRSLEVVIEASSLAGIPSPNG